MRKYLLNKLIGLLVTLFIASIMVFLIIHIIPGNPAEIMSGPGASQADINALTQRMGLDQPLWKQYVDWISNILLHGDLGDSLYTNEPVSELISNSLGKTLILSFSGIMFAILLGIPFGIISALKQNSIIDVVIMGISIIGVSMPIFWLALLLVMQFSINIPIFPATGSGTWLHLVLPSISIGLNSLAVIARMTRSSMLEVLKLDYIRTAEAKGISSYKIILKHALKNAMIPIVTTIAIQFGYLLGGAVLTETVFVYPGLGRLLVNSISRRDYTTIQGCMLVITAMFVVMNTLVDMIYPLFDPRVKIQNSPKVRKSRS